MLGQNKNETNNNKQNKTKTNKTPQQQKFKTPNQANTVNSSRSQLLQDGHFK
jgi:hypothetical protein